MAVVDGRQIPAYFDFYEAEDREMLTRSAWRAKGRKVPKGELSSGVVISQKSLLPKCMVPRRMLTPILGEQNDMLVIATKWDEVFTEHQTEERKPQSPNSKVVNLNSNSLKEREEGGESALMTQEPSEPHSSSGLMSSAAKTPKSTVNSVRAYVPEGLSLPDNCPVKEQVWWLLGLLYWKHLERRLPWDEPIHLKYDYLKDNIPNWPEVWAWCDQRLVKRTPGYIPGEKAYGYWTALPYREQTHRLRTFDHAGLSKRLKAIERTFLSRPILAHLKQQLTRLSVDMEAFDSKFATHPNHRYYLAHLQTIVDGEFRLKPDDFSGRFHSNVSNMFKPLRALLRVDGHAETLGETDIKNSQPLFLGMAAKEAGFNDDKYMRLCEEGRLYDHMANRLGVLRDSAKHEVVMMLFAKQRFRSTAKSVFEIEFPTITAYIHEIKTKDYKRLAQQMQTLERKYVIDTVCERLKRLRPQMFLATIHDSILAQKADCDLIVSVMSEAFAERGVNPRLEWQDVARHI